MTYLILSAILASTAAAQTSDTEWGRVRGYFSAGAVFARDDAGFSKQTPYVGFNLDKNWRSGNTMLVNTFFETRLTSIPVGESRVAAFPASEKAAQVNVGVYAPVLTTRWTFGGNAQALFVAPLLTAGFDTPTDTRVDHFYTRSAGGARLGHFRLPAGKDAAPELISWLDVSYGRFTSIGDRRLRLAVEGTLKAPGTPVVVGFAANVGPSGSARDDLRFFLGTRFDLGALIAKLRQ